MVESNDNEVRELLQRLHKINKSNSHENSIGISETQKKAEKDRSDIIAIQTATILKDSLTKELEDKIKLRKYLIIGLGVFFMVITIAVFSIIILMNKSVNIDVQKYLITGLFGNLIGLLFIVYRYAFSDTHKITKSISDLMH